MVGAQMPRDGPVQPGSTGSLAIAVAIWERSPGPVLDPSPQGGRERRNEGAPRAVRSQLIGLFLAVGALTPRSVLLIPNFFWLDGWVQNSSVSQTFSM